MEKLVRVGAESNTRFLADLIVDGLNSESQIILQAIGVKAVYQAVKAAVTAQKSLQPHEKVCLTAEFIDVDIDGAVRTAIRFVLCPASSSVGSIRMD